MYLYFIPKCGFNDILYCIQQAIDYCIKYKRILLIDGQNSEYHINFADYFTFPHDPRVKIIHDAAQITTLLQTHADATVYPKCFENNLNKLNKGEYNFAYTNETNYNYLGTSLTLPKEDRQETIVVCSYCGGGPTYALFKQLIFSEKVIQACHARYESIGDKTYLGVQIRNTDYKCDYVADYEKIKLLVQAYKKLYVATDDRKALQFYQDKHAAVYNFATFPPAEEYYYSLHYTRAIDPHTKFVDLISDLFLLALSDKIVSCSQGWFIGLARDCHADKETVAKQFQFKVV